MALNSETLSGVDEMIVRLNRILGVMPDFIGRALRAETEIEATESKRRSPVDVIPGHTGGTLRASIHAAGPFRRGGDIWCKVVAGGGAASAYALIQHEELSYIHRVGQAKYVESVIMESRPFIAARVARRMQLSQLVA